MKKFIIILLCITTIGLLAESFRFPVIQEYKFPRISRWVFPHFLNTDSMFIQVESNFDIHFIHFDGRDEVLNFNNQRNPYANYDGKNILIKDRETKTYSLFNCNTKESTIFAKYISVSYSPSQYYQDGILFGFKIRDENEYYPTIGNMNSGVVESLPFYDQSKHGYVLIRDMSPDKMHLLWDSSKTGLSLFDIQKQELSDSFYPNEMHNTISTAVFLTSSLLYAPYDGPYSAIHDLFGNYYIIEKINGQPGESIIVISKDLTRCIVESRDKNASEYTYKLLDSTPLKDFLDKAGLLYKPTTATLNDDNVRVRENPNLEAKHMGFLKKGETISVLDRSGLKRTIEPWGEHYWYQIKRESDGLTGWAFGAFLDLKDVQGDIVINAEEIRKRVNQ